MIAELKFSCLLVVEIKWEFVRWYVLPFSAPLARSPPRAIDRLARPINDAGSSWFFALVRLHASGLAAHGRGRGRWESGAQRGRARACRQGARAALLEEGRVREGGVLDGRGAQVAYGAEVIVGRGRLTLRVGGGDVLAERAVEVDGRGLLLVDRQHDVRRHGDGSSGRRRGDRGRGELLFLH